MLDWFITLFTLENLTFFVAGVVSATAWHLIKARIQHRILIIQWKYIAVPLVLSIAAQMAFQNQQNADCVREFNQVLRDRSSVTSENDQISQQQRQLIYHWMHSLVFPPPQIARLPGDDPEREQWAINLTLETDRQFRESLDRQQEIDGFRAAHPLPPPTCGL
jgi:hypothetical protein